MSALPSDARRGPGIVDGTTSVRPTSTQTRPRAALCAGLEFTGEVVHGDARGRELGFPTANLRVAAGVTLPRDGVYVALATIPGWGGGAGTRRRAALSVGDNPTFGVGGLRVEAHLLDFDGDLYGHTVRIRVLDYLRQMRDFPSVRALVDAIGDDVTAVRRWEW